MNDGHRGIAALSTMRRLFVSAKTEWRLPKTETTRTRTRRRRRRRFSSSPPRRATTRFVVFSPEKVIFIIWLKSICRWCSFLRCFVPRCRLLKSFIFIFYCSYVQASLNAAPIPDCRLSVVEEWGGRTCDTPPVSVSAKLLMEKVPSGEERAVVGVVFIASAIQQSVRYSTRWNYTPGN